MASGFGYFEGNAVALTTYNGVIVAAKVEQSVNTSARTVTVSVTAYVGYKRMAGGSWTISPDNTRIWQTNHSDAYLSATAGDATNSVTKSFGAFVNGVQTVNTGTVLTVYAGQLKGTTTWSGTSYTNYVVSSKTYSYDSAGSAINGTWSVHLHEYDSTYGWKDSTASGSFTTDSIGSAASAPSGAAVKYNSSTHNSINITSTVSSWGTGYTDTPHLQQIVCLPDSTASNWYQRGRRVHDNRTTAKTSTGTEEFYIWTWNDTTDGVWIKGTGDVSAVVFSGNIQRLPLASRLLVGRLARTRPIA